MAEAATITQDDVDRLQKFHEAHFVDQPVPKIITSHAASNIDQDDHLGYYDDGVKRTLTDEQISMFRSSEIQRLLQERRRKQEQEEDNKKKRKRQYRKAITEDEARGNYVRSDNDEVVHQRESVKTLSYDEQSSVKTMDTNTHKTFFWPRLGP